ncbi:HNH endonuclease [Clostridium sp. UBA1652]|uniref:HNH endonuclease n=1 Tax=Clostridium sp. UBA1652 TaxID=1946348 RepID=UPI00257B762C|nr:HNH endonuclease [Clostridium sp. UBA1652]
MIRVERKPVPSDLAKLVKDTKNYRHQVVVEKIKENFNNKCYLCEIKESTSINIEHFIPHRGDENLKYKWSNLYFACSHCNGIKGHRYDNILDPLNEDIESYINCRMDAVPMAKVIIEGTSQDEKVINTVNLLDEIFNKCSELAGVRTEESRNLRNKLLKELRSFQNSLFIYYDGDELEEDREKAKKEIRKHLRSKSQFTAFKRCLIREKDVIYEEFKDEFI